MAMLTRSKPLPESAGWGKGADITVRYGFHVIGNQEPYFSITADITTPQSRRRNDIQAGGCLHDEIAKHFPQLAELIPFHLSAFKPDGGGAALPTHYVANGVYWAELALGVSEWSGRSDSKSPEESKRILADHCMCGVVGDTDELDSRLMAFRAAWSNGAKQSAKADFEAWLVSRIPAMTDSMRAAMEKHGIRVEDADRT